MGHIRYCTFMVIANFSLLADLELDLLWEQQVPGLRSGEEDLGHEGFTSDSGQCSSDCSSDILAAIRPTRQLLQVKSITTTKFYAAEWDPVLATMRKPSLTEYAGFSNLNHTVLLHVAPAVHETLAVRMHQSSHRVALPAIFAENATWFPDPNKLNSNLSSQHHSVIQGAADPADANHVLHQQRQQQQQQQQQDQFLSLWERMIDLVHVKGQMWQHGHHSEINHTVMHSMVAAVIICVLVSVAITVIAWNSHAFGYSRWTWQTSHRSSASRIRSPLQRDMQFRQMASRDLPQRPGTATAVRTGAAAVRTGTSSPQRSFENAPEPFLVSAQSWSQVQQRVPNWPTLQMPDDGTLSHTPSLLPCAMDTTLQLCGELVVPAGKECCLFLPQIPVSTLLEGGHVSLDDVHGTPVFNVTFFPHGEPTGKYFELRSAVDDHNFGHCQDVADGGSMLDSLALCHQSGTPFGILQPDQGGGFVMRAMNGWTVSIQDDGQSRAWAVEVGSGRLLAVTEVGLSTAVQRIMRIGPAVDAGLMGLIMLGTDILLYRLHNLERTARSASREGQS